MRSLLLTLLLLSGCAAQPAHLFDSPLLAQASLTTPSPAQVTPRQAPRAQRRSTPRPPRPEPSVSPQRPTIKPATSISEAYRACKKAGRVHFKKTLKPGDVAFFHNTFDANGDGRNNDWYTASATVTQVTGAAASLVTPDGQRLTMSLARPADGPPHNTALRARTPRDLPYTLYNAAQLWAGTCAAP